MLAAATAAAVSTVTREREFLQLQPTAMAADQADVSTFLSQVTLG